MLNVQGLRRNMKNVVRNYTDAQVKVREATSNDPWGPSSTLMSEIADLTYNVVAFSEIMQMIWKRLNDHGKNWRHVYKALVLLDYLIKTGSEKVAQQCKENIFAIQTLKDFQHIEENKDQGMNVREKSKQLVALLKDDERLKNERARALKAKERFAQATSHVGNEASRNLGSPGGKDSAGSSPDGALANRDPNYCMDNKDADVATPPPSHVCIPAYDDAVTHAGIVSTELENARPQTAGEEELQLQLALAMSKEEAEQEERLRRNDDLRLQMALNESQENFKKTQGDEQATPKPPGSHIDDLLALNSATPTVQATPPTTDPWGMPVGEKPADPWSSTSPIGAGDNDPWSPAGVPSPARPPPSAAGASDPWGAVSLSGPNNAWVPRMSTSASVSFETLGGRTNGDADEYDPLSKRSAMSSPDTTIQRTTPNPFDMAGLKESLNNNLQTKDGSQNYPRKTPESFLGPNSNLVNLDALVSAQGTTQEPPSAGNPFGVPPPVSNPFQATRPPPPTINQLRAQNQFIPFAPMPPHIPMPPVVQPPAPHAGLPAATPYLANPPANNPFL